MQRACPLVLFTALPGRPASVGAPLNGAGVSYYVSDIGNAAAVTVNLTGGTAETVRGAPVVTDVPRNWTLPPSTVILPRLTRLPPSSPTWRF